MIINYFPIIGFISLRLSFKYCDNYHVFLHRLNCVHLFWGGSFNFQQRIISCSLHFTVWLAIQSLIDPIFLFPPILSRRIGAFPGPNHPFFTWFLWIICILIYGWLFAADPQILLQQPPISVWFRHSVHLRRSGTRQVRNIHIYRLLKFHNKKSQTSACRSMPRLWFVWKIELSDQSKQLFWVLFSEVWFTLFLLISSSLHFFFCVPAGFLQ